MTKAKIITFNKLARYSNSWAYAENGNIKAYANKTQANNKANELNSAGSNVSVSMSHPCLIIQSN